MERTLILIKPDAFARGLSGEIIARFERKGLRIAALRHMRLERDLAELDYSLCPHCDHVIERDFLRCPSCRRKLKDPCPQCSKPLDPTWQLCPYCEYDFTAAPSTSAGRSKSTAAPRRRRRTTSDTPAVEAEPSSS